MDINQKGSFEIIYPPDTRGFDLGDVDKDFHLFLGGGGMRLNFTQDFRFLPMHDFFYILLLHRTVPRRSSQVLRQASPAV